MRRYTQPSSGDGRAGSPAMSRIATMLVAVAFAMLGACAGYYPPGAYPGSNGAPGDGYPQGYPATG